MCTTHERIARDLRSLSRQPDKYPDFQFYPCMPYAHKYANAVGGTGRARSAPQFPARRRTPWGPVQGRRVAGDARISKAGELLIDAEMKMFAGLNTPVIFLQNVVDRFPAGAGFDEAFRIFADCVREALRRRARLHHHERAAAARRAGEGRHQESDHLRQHQQDRLPDVRRHAAYEELMRAAVAGRRDVGLCQRRAAAAEALEYVCDTGDRVDRVRRLEPAATSARRTADRSVDSRRDSSTGRDRSSGGVAMTCRNG